MLVIVSDREDSPQLGPEQRINAYGIDPKRTNSTEFVFQAALTRAQLAAFLKSVVDCEQPSSNLLAWIPTVIQPTPIAPPSATGDTINTVVISNGDPPTTGPKMMALFAYANAFAECENAPATPSAGSAFTPANDETSRVVRPGGKTAYRAR